MSASISPVQQMVLGYMREFFGENDQLPPAHRIAEHFGWKSPANAEWHVKVLRIRGYIEPNAVGKYRFTREAQPA